MNVDAIVGRLVKRLNRHILNFPEPSAGTVRLPGPTQGRRYLLYLHIPYCTQLCPYCSFHRVQFERENALSYFESLRNEIELVSNTGYVFDELYVGGGTPTVLPDDLIHTLQRLRDRYPLKGISVETNPDYLRNPELHELSNAGVNRLSVGVQSFDDRLLMEMRRYKQYGSGDDIQRRLKNVSGTFDTINVDMIFNLPHQTEVSLRRDLDILINDIGVDQVSFYPLMVSDLTRNTLEDAMGRVVPSREKRYYELIAARMLSAGYERTSAWCFSRKPGMFDEYIVEREEYVGLGSGAFSYLQGSLYASTFSIGEYGRSIATGKTGTARSRKMSARNQMQYYLLMRLFGGVLDKAAAEHRFHGHFQRKLWPELSALKAIGAIEDTGARLILTESGQYLWVILMREFFSGINTLRDQMKHKNTGSEIMLRTAE